MSDTYKLMCCCSICQPFDYKENALNRFCLHLLDDLQRDYQKMPETNQRERYNKSIKHNQEIQSSQLVFAQINSNFLNWSPFYSFSPFSPSLLRDIYRLNAIFGSFLVFGARADLLYLGGVPDPGVPQSGPVSISVCPFHIAH